MKNKNLFLYLAGVITLISCGTASHASYSGSKYQNGIYYTPDANTVYAEAKNQEELRNLQGKTKTTFQNSTQQSSYNNKTGVETIYVGDTNLVNIQYNPNVTYSVVDDNESYESRLRKFDSPTYTININLDDSNYYPWWDVNFGWYRPYGVTWGTGWYNPWWGSYYSWYGPRHWNHWYGPRWGWGWNDWYSWNGYYDPWFDPWYRPGYYPGYWPSHSHRPNRDVYYGRRESSPTYNNRPGMSNNGGSYTRRQPGINQIRGNNNGSYTGRNENNSQQAGNTGGSSYRRGNGTQGYNGAVYNNGVINRGSGSSSNQGQGYRPPVNNNNNNNQGSMYRRSATRNNSSTYSNSSRENNTQTYRNNGNNNNNTYNQNTYNRGSSTRSTGSSFGTGSSYSGSSSGTTSGGGTSGGGSSYRRR